MPGLRRRTDCRLVEAAMLEQVHQTPYDYYYRKHERVPRIEYFCLQEFGILTTQLTSLTHPALSFRLWWALGWLRTVHNSTSYHGQGHPAAAQHVLCLGRTRAILEGVTINQSQVSNGTNADPLLAVGAGRESLSHREWPQQYSMARECRWCGALLLPSLTKGLAKCQLHTSGHH
jgi:hypothetical protein